MNKEETWGANFFKKPLFLFLTAPPPPQSSKFTFGGAQEAAAKREVGKIKF